MPGVYQRYHKCSVCGIEFKALRFDADTCSPACRTRKHRIEQKHIDRRNEAHRLVRELVDRVATSPTAEDINCLKWIEQQAREAIAAVEQEYG